MNWSSIVMFIAIAIISSIFNKGKEQQKRKPNSQRDTTTTKPTNIPKQHNQTPKHRRTTGLEDMLKEFQKGIGTMFEELQPQRDASDYDDVKSKRVVEEDNSTLNETTYTTENETMDVPKKRSNHYSVGSYQKPQARRKLSFSKKDVVNGIIMAEILGKPKSLRNR